MKPIKAFVSRCHATAFSPKPAKIYQILGEFPLPARHLLGRSAALRHRIAVVCNINFLVATFQSYLIEETSFSSLLFLLDIRVIMLKCINEHFL